MPPPIQNKEILNEIVAARADLCIVDEKITNLSEKVDRNSVQLSELDRLLYKGNGREGLVSRVNDLEDKQDLREQKRQEDIKIQKSFVYSLIGAIILIIIDIALHYFSVI